MPSDMQIIPKQSLYMSELMRCNKIPLPPRLVTIMPDLVSSVPLCSCLECLRMCAHVFSVIFAKRPFYLHYFLIVPPWRLKYLPNEPSGHPVKVAMACICCLNVMIFDPCANPLFMVNCKLMPRSHVCKHHEVSRTSCHHSLVRLR